MTTKCLNPICISGKNPALRGLCTSCYSSASRLVRIKRTTWDELEKNGKALVAEGRKSSVSEWFLAKNEP